MSADTQSRVVSSDDDELFVPAQSYNSDDDRFLDAFHSENLSTEETSSKENDKNSEDERDGAQPQALHQSKAESAATASGTAVKRKKKKTKRSKTGGSKSSKSKAKTADADLELLDALIAQNANTIPAVVTPVKTETVAAKPVHRKKLKDLLREKREAANSLSTKRLSTRSRPIKPSRKRSANTWRLALR